MTTGHIFDQVEAFLGRYIAYPSEHARVAHVLWIAHTWAMECWESTPRIAFLSPEPGSGKSRALEVTEPLVPRPVHAVNTTSAYLFRKVSDPDGAPTILYDEVDTVFGPKTAKDNEDIRGMLNAGHRRGAVAGRCVIKGKQVVTEELPAYCAVALAGLDDLPDTLRSRSMLVRMRRRAADEVVQPWRLREAGPVAGHLAEQLEAWAVTHWDQLDGAWPDFPAGVADRAADVWEAPLALADAAGGDWPERARAAAVYLVAESLTAVPSLGVRLLADLLDVFVTTGRDVISTVRLVELLLEIEDTPWADVVRGGKPLDGRALSRRLSRYDVKPKPIKRDGSVFKGYDAADLLDAWQRYADPSAVLVQTDAGWVVQRSSGVTEVTEVTGAIPALPTTTGVTDVSYQSQSHTEGEGLELGSPPIAPVTSVTQVTPICPVCGLALDQWLLDQGFTVHVGCIGHE